MGRICPRVSQQWCGYFTSQVLPPTGTRTYGLGATFLCYYSEPLRPDVFLRRCSLLRRCLTSGDVSARRCLFLGDASSGRPVGFPSLGPLRNPTMCLILTSGQRPGTGRYTDQTNKQLIQTPKNPRNYSLPQRELLKPSK